MEENLKFNSQICTTKEQSKRLLEFGLKPETADMSYYILDNEPVLTIGIAQAYREIIKGGKIVEKQNAEVLPAWSLHRLLCLLYPREDVYLIMPSTAYDDIIDDIENEIKCGGFNKEYLKQ